MRNLATIQTIASLEDIPGKDRIKLAHFKSIGFQTVVDLSVKAGDKVVYCEVDSILPEKPEFEFLRSRCYNKKYQGFRIKIMKLGEIYSEGIVFPISLLPVFKVSLTDGEDVTELLGIRKYDPEEVEETKEPPKGLKKLLMKYAWYRALDQKFNPKDSSVWPDFFPGKTDETRLSNLPQLLSINLSSLGDVYITEKLDGSSISIGMKRGKLYVCSRNRRLVRPEGKYWGAVKYHGLDKALKAYNRLYEPVVVQGELIGPGIQKNPYKLSQAEIRFFNVYSIKREKYYDYHELLDFNRRIKVYSYSHKPLQMVPVLYSGSWPFPEKDTLSALTEYSKGESKLYPTKREGIVIRTFESKEPWRGMSNMFSFKVINPEFLMEKG